MLSFAEEMVKHVFTAAKSRSTAAAARFIQEQCMAYINIDRRISEVAKEDMTDGKGSPERETIVEKAVGSETNKGDIIADGQVGDKHANNVDTATNKSSQAEKAINQGKSLNHKQPTDQHSYGLPPPCENCNKPGHKTKTCTEPTRCFKCGQRGHLISDCTQDQVYRCWNCGKDGHIQRDCLYCATCNKEGHPTRECPITSICLECGERGHYGIDCPEGWTTPGMRVSLVEQI